MRISVLTFIPKVHPRLHEHLDSINAQTHAPDELVVCNAGPEMCEGVQRFAAGATFPVRTTASSENIETALDLCTGEVVVLTEPDNTWSPEMLAEIVSTFSKSPESALVLVNANLVDERRRPLGCSFWESIGFGPAEQKALQDKKKLTHLLRQDAASTIAFRSSYKDVILPVTENIPARAWIALVVSTLGRVALIERSLSDYCLGGTEKFSLETANENGGNDLAKELNVVSRVAERLASNEASKCAPYVRDLAARIDHLSARSNLPAQRAKRIRLVIKELLTRRYHLYSYGFNSALKDVLVRQL
jgi:hypothetical protein